MRLELYSGEDVPEAAVERLKRVLAFDVPTLEMFIQAIVSGASAIPKAVSKSDMEKLKAAFALTDDRAVRRLIWTMLELVLRVYAGRMTQVAQEELVRAGFPENSVKSLPTILNQLSQKDKDALKFWAIETETIADRSHIHAIATEADTKTVTDNGSIVSVLPISVIRIRTSQRDVREESTWRLELTYPELEFLLHYLDVAKQELAIARQELKKKLGDLVITEP
jgi:hypothetical protein